MEVETRRRPANHSLGRHRAGLAWSNNPCCLDIIRRLPAADRVHRTVSGVHLTPVRRHSGSAVYQRRAVLVLAVLSFRHFGDAYAILLLSIWIGIGFIFQGVSEVAVSIGEQNLPGRGWYAVLGVISVIAGFVVLVWPFDSIVVLVLVTGVWLVVMGVVQIVQAFQIRKDAKTVREAVDSVSERFGTTMTQQFCVARPPARSRDSTSEG